MTDFAIVIFNSAPLVTTESFALFWDIIDPSLYSFVSFSTITKFISFSLAQFWISVIDQFSLTKSGYFSKTLGIYKR